jgi:hypothetical protein
MSACGASVEVDLDCMAGKVVPFLVAARTASTGAILARHHVVIEVGQSRYDVDVMDFVTRLQPALAARGGPVRFLLNGSGTEREPAAGVQVLEWSQSRRQGWKWYCS